MIILLNCLLAKVTSVKKSLFGTWKRLGWYSVINKNNNGVMTKIVLFTGLPHSNCHTARTTVLIHKPNPNQRLDCRLVENNPKLRMILNYRGKGTFSKLCWFKCHDNVNCSHAWQFDSSNYLLAVVLTSTLSQGAPSQQLVFMWQFGHNHLVETGSYAAPQKSQGIWLLAPLDN